METYKLNKLVKRPYEKAVISVVEVQPIVTLAMSGTGATTDNFVWDNEEPQG